MVASVPRISKSFHASTTYYNTCVQRYAFPFSNGLLSVVMLIPEPTESKLTSAALASTVETTQSATSFNSQYSKQLAYLLLLVFVLYSGEKRSTQQSQPQSYQRQNVRSVQTPYLLRQVHLFWHCPFQRLYGTASPLHHHSTRLWQVCLQFHETCMFSEMMTFPYFIAYHFTA